MELFPNNEASEQLNLTMKWLLTLAQASESRQSLVPVATCRGSARPIRHLYEASFSSHPTSSDP